MRKWWSERASKGRDIVGVREESREEGLSPQRKEESSTIGKRVTQKGRE
jgi:hypothetical protein